jgi:hypothetical protein
MKTKYRLSILITASLMIISQGCTWVLEEDPKTTFTNQYFETPQGIQDGINAAYASLRFQYGTNPALGLNVTGTDEFTYGPEPNYNTSGDNLPHKLLGTYDVSPSAGYLTVTFNRTFPIINMLNGLIQFAPNIAGMSEAEKVYIVAQARYLRAHYYYLLVGQFGAVPVDFGGGDYEFNKIPFYGFNRLDPELLKKNYDLMISDLIFASENLEVARRADAYKLSRAAALHLLAKIYLFRSYHPTLAQTTDAQNAYDAAIELINNRAMYGVALQQDFGDVHRQGTIGGKNNDYNTEILFAAERIPLNNLNNEYTNPGGIGDREMMANNCFNCNYEQPRLLTYPAVTGNDGDVIDGRPFALQRPLRKLAPTPWLTEVAFADKVNDSRYHNSFRTLWTASTQQAAGTAAYSTFITKLANHGRVLGDTAFYLADSPAQAATLTGKYYPVYSSATWYTNQRYPTSGGAVLVYPSLKKYDDVNRAAPNDASGRPVPIFRLSETYLLAAEAAFKLGDNAEAADLINVVRQRAAYRPSRPGMNAAQNTAANAAAAAAMEIDAGDIDLDFILDERARELCGEMLRWVDLAMRGDDVFVNRVKLNPDAQNVQPKHRLRPIPQQQLDAIEDTNKAQYQNPGY